MGKKECVLPHSICLLTLLLRDHYLCATWCAYEVKVTYSRDEFVVHMDACEAVVLWFVHKERTTCRDESSDTVDECRLAG